MRLLGFYRDVPCPRGDPSLCRGWPKPSDRNVTNARGNIVRMKRRKIVTHYKFVHASEHAPPDRLLIQVAEPTFDQVQPTGTRGDKVEHEARMTLQPVPHILVLMRSIVIHDEMERDFTGELLVQSA